MDLPLDLLGAAWGLVWGVLAHPVHPIGYVGTILTFPVIAFAYLALLSRFNVRTYRYWRVARLYFAARFFRQRSHLLDVFMTIANTYVFAVLLGWAILSSLTIGQQTSWLLAHAFGPSGPTTLSPSVVIAIWTVAQVLAYELGYWLDHYLSHRVPLLWEFHKVHHSAQVLTPLTVFRVHPVDTLVYYNILAIVMGMTMGSLTYVFGDASVLEAANRYQVLYVVIAMHLVGHFQHSQFWIPFTGWLGRLVLSPAHHQIHHSNDARHYDRNFGSFLAIFDWMFGTLHVPSRKREKLTFGVTGVTEHSLTEGLVQPFGDAARHLQPPPAPRVA